MRHEVAEHGRRAAARRQLTSRLRSARGGRTKLGLIILFFLEHRLPVFAALSLTQLMRSALERIVEAVTLMSFRFLGLPAVQDARIVERGMLTKRQ